MDLKINIYINQYLEYYKILLLKKIKKFNKIFNQVDNFKIILFNNIINRPLKGSFMETPNNDIKHQALYKLLNEHQPVGDQILLSIVLPVYNEENTIRNILENLPLHKSIEIIVVNDNSYDNSVEEIKKVMTKRSITLINHERNKGYGGAIISGVGSARGKIVITMDSDGQHNPFDTINLVTPIFNNEADCVIGSRYLGSYHYELPLSTRLGEVVVEKLIRILFGPKIKNNQSGFRAFHENTLHIFQGSIYEGYTFATETILRAKLYKYRVIECPIILKDREHGSSKIVLRVLLLNILSCFFRYFIKRIQSFNPNKKL